MPSPANLHNDLNAPFSWSYSRARTLEECARAYYHRYYGSWGGWRADAPAETRLTYRLKHLQTLHQVFGTAVHECARSCVEAIRDGLARPTHTDMLAAVLTALRGACASSKDRAAWECKPKCHTMLDSMYYKGTWDLSEIDVVRSKLDRCLVSLAATRVWHELEAIGAGGILLIDALEAVEIGRVRVYAAPDLVVIDDDRVVVLDWKTGAEVDEERVEMQLAIYALVAMKRFGWRFHDFQWSGRIISLYDGRDETIRLTRLDLMRASHRIRESVEEMRGYVADCAENRPRPIEAFPMAHPAFRFQCSTCPFREICIKVR